MSEYKDITIESEENNGKIVFAEDVVATIATLAASEVEGVYGMSGSAFEGIGEKLGKKNYTKGIKVEVGTVECAVDMTIIVRYGFRIQEVCRNDDRSQGCSGQHLRKLDRFCKRDARGASEARKSRKVIDLSKPKLRQKLADKHG